jgi:hypothetical protein
MFPICNLIEQAGMETLEAQKSTCDFEGPMVSNSVYDEGNITRRCKKMIFEDI